MSLLENFKFHGLHYVSTRQCCFKQSQVFFTESKRKNGFSYFYHFQCSLFIPEHLSSLLASFVFKLKNIVQHFLQSRFNGNKFFEGFFFCKCLYFTFILKEYFPRLRIQADLFFLSLSTLKMLFHCLWPPKIRSVCSF